MPVHVEIFSAGGQLIKEVEPVPPTEYRYVSNYYLGELSSIIGALCLENDLGGEFHLIDNQELIVAIKKGMDVVEALSDETALLRFYPGSRPVEMPFTSRNGNMGNVSFYHDLPENPLVYN